MLMPWHYHDPFFQETPMVYDLDLDVYYKDKDVKKLAETFYDGHRPAGRGDPGPQRPVRAGGQEPARVLHAHRPRGRRAGPVQSQEQ